MEMLYDVTGIDEVMKGLQDINVDNRVMRRGINIILRKVLRDGRRQLSKDARSALSNDPRKAYQAVRHVVYRRIIGGQMNILARRKANKWMYVGHKAGTLQPGQHGGNRRKRGSRTEQMDGYYGTDRGFILRFLNAGTDARLAGTAKEGSGNKPFKRPANRGSIAARNWFSTSSQAAMEKVAGQFCELVERAVREVWTTGSLPNPT